MSEPAPPSPIEPTRATQLKAPPPAAVAPAPVEADANALSPEEQMARFEKELKENDWGHQPC